MRASIFITIRKTSSRNRLSDSLGSDFEVQQAQGSKLYVTLDRVLSIFVFSASEFLLKKVKIAEENCTDSFNGTSFCHGFCFCHVKSNFCHEKFTHRLVRYCFLLLHSLAFALLRLKSNLKTLSLSPNSSFQNLFFESTIVIFNPSTQIQQNSLVGHLLLHVRQIEG